jgi:hypothetical protein
MACWMAYKRRIQWYISYVSSITQTTGYGFSFMRFLDYTQRLATVGRTLLDEWSARRRDLYLTTHNRQTSMPPVGFEPMTLAGERPQPYALDHATTGTGASFDDESFVLFFFKPYATLRSHSRLSSLWDKTSQRHLASPAAAVVPDYSLLYLRVTTNY